LGAIAIERALSLRSTLVRIDCGCIQSQFAVVNTISLVVFVPKCALGRCICRDRPQQRARRESIRSASEERERSFCILRPCLSVCVIDFENYFSYIIFFKKKRGRATCGSALRCGVAPLMRTGNWDGHDQQSSSTSRSLCFFYFLIHVATVALRWRLRRRTRC
jgi:hypothetical protein